MSRMTEQQIQDYIGQVSGYDADVIAGMIEKTTAPNAGSVFRLNASVMGPDVLEDITKLAILIKTYNDKISGEAADDAASAAAALETIRELSERIYDIVGDAKTETDLEWRYGFVQANGSVTVQDTPTRAIVTTAITRDSETRMVEYTGESFNGDVPYFVHIAQYRAGTPGTSTFISRKTLHYEPDNIHNVVTLDDNCAVYLYVIGYTASSGVKATLEDADNFEAKKYTEKAAALQDEITTIENKMYGDLVPVPVETVPGTVNAVTGAISSASAYYVRPSVPINVTGHKYVHYTSPVTLGDFAYGIAFYTEGLYDGDTIAASPENYFISGNVATGNPIRSGYEWRTVPIPTGATWMMLNYWAVPELYNNASKFYLYFADRYEYGSDYAARHSSGSGDFLTEEARRLGLHTIPENMTQLNIVRRCRQMTDIRWTPAVDLPRVDMILDGEVWIRNKFDAGVEYVGIPYTKCSDTDLEPETTDYDFACEDYQHNNFYVGFVISPETFVTSVRNANSMVCERGSDILENEEYTEYPPDHSSTGVDQNHIKNHVGLAYGLVCSALASYSLGLVTPKTAAQIGSIPGITQKAAKLSDWWDGEKLADRLKLGDLLNYSGHHSAVVTDIIRDANGDIIIVEVSEATPAGNGNEDVFGGHDGGVCRRRGFTPAALIQSRGENYAVLRYTGSNVPYSQDKFTRLDGEPDMYRYVDLAVMPYEGSRFAYKKSWLATNPIKLIISATGYNRLLIYTASGDLVDTVTIQPDATSYEIAAGGYAVGEYKVCLALYDNDTEKRRTVYGYFSVAN